MNDAALKFETQDIVVDEVFPHAPETIWKALTTSELIARWIHMVPTNFAPVVGNRFTFQMVSGTCGKTSSTTMSWICCFMAVAFMDRSP